MKTIKVYFSTEPVLDIKEDGFMLHRDRVPDRDWSELRYTNSNVTPPDEVELTPKLRKTLLVDLAYAYGQNSTKFTNKLIEFDLI